MQLFTKKQPDFSQERGEFHHLFWLRLVNIIVIGIYACSFFMIGMFIQQNVYRAIQSEYLLLQSKDKFPTEAIQFDRLERVRMSWQKKHDTVKITINRDPFTPPTSTLR